MSIFNNKELATAKQQNTQLLERLAAKHSLANHHEQNSRSHEARAISAERARDAAESALEKSQQEIASLKSVISQMNAESLFIKIGKTSHLIPSIHTIVSDDDGNVESVNGHKCNQSANTPTDALESIVTAYHHRRAAR